MIINKLKNTLKMKKILLCISVIIFGIVYFGCSDNDDECTETPVASTYEELPAINSTTEYSLQNTDKTKDSVYLTIKTEVDYKKYVASNMSNYNVTEDSLPSIDFNKKTLLAGRYKSKYSDKVLSMSIKKACDTYSLTVTIGGGARPATTNVCYFAIVDKTGSDAKVSIILKH
jgi:hypothetical protein